MNSSGSHLRVARVVLEGFKGFNERTEFDFGDADVVLISGANGRGKTTLMEALELAVTGEIRQRVGDKSDYSIRDFINARTTISKSSARVEVKWAGVDDPEVVRIDPAGKGAVNATGPCAARRAAGEGTWSSTGISQLRANALLYSESLGSMLGLDAKTRGEALDRFLTPRVRASKLVSEESGKLEALVNEALGAVRLRTNALEQARSQVLRVVQKVQVALDAVCAGAAPKLLKRDSALVADPLGALRKVAPMLQVAAPSEWSSPALEEFEAAISARADEAELREQELARERSLGEQTRVALSQALQKAQGRRYAPTPEAAEASLLQCVSEASLRARELEVKGVAERAAAAITRRETQASGGKLLLGTLPLLASIEYLLLAHPAAIHELGLHEWSSERVTAARAAEEAGLVASREERARAMEILDNLRQERAERQRRQDQVVTSKAIATAWEQFIGAPPTATPDGLDLDAMRSALKDTSVPDPGLNEPKSVELRGLASALRGLSAALSVLEVASTEAALDPAWGLASAELESMQGLLPRLRGLDPAIRGVLVEKHYQVAMNRAVRRVLAGYKHRPHIRRETRVAFDKSHILRVYVGANERAPMLASLSRSQYTSVMVAIALAANLGTPDPPLGFVCLDDVSDALDLENLAADAMLFRMLAYSGCRQLILTNHNDEITDRLVPRLLPPKGRTMRIIELRDSGSGDGVTPHHWDVRGEDAEVVAERRSPLMAILPADRSDS